MTSQRERAASGSQDASPHGPATALVPPAARAFQGKPAGIVSRAIANGIDVGVVVGTLVAAYLGWTAVLFLWNSRSFSVPAPSFGLVLLIGQLLLTAYFTVTWMTVGRTYGDHLVGLRVVTAQDGRVHLWRAFLRAILCTIFPLGLLWVALSRDNRSVQDIVMRTTVVYDWAGTAR